jgi:hypothetical protein
MAVEVKRPPRPASLERVLAAHREEAARLREELGDPAEALSSWVREHYNRADPEQVYDDMLRGVSFWAEDDADWNDWTSR